MAVFDLGHEAHPHQPIKMERASPNDFPLSPDEVGQLGR